MIKVSDRTVAWHEGMTITDLLQAIDALLHHTLKLNVGGDLLLHLFDLQLRALIHPRNALKRRAHQAAAHQILRLGSQDAGGGNGQGQGRKTA